jgi:hypothetical protein
MARKRGLFREGYSGDFLEKYRIAVRGEGIAAAVLIISIIFYDLQERYLYAIWVVTTGRGAGYINFLVNFFRFVLASWLSVCGGRRLAWAADFYCAPRGGNYLHGKARITRFWRK